MIQVMAELIACKLRNGTKLLLLAIAVSVVVPNALGQAQAAQIGNTADRLPAYDVVSIKPNKSGSGSSDIDSQDGIYSASNISLKQLLVDAYDIRQDLISGLTGPIASARFDIEAKIVDPDRDALGKLTDKQRRSMLLPFLMERFQLKAHTEIKILPVYELVVIKSGPKFAHSSGDWKQAGTHIQNRNLTARDIPMSSLASSLAGQVHRTVIDKTGLQGNYDLALKWSDDDAPDAQTDAAPSIFTALQEQLGLKLQPAKGPVETLVVDNAEMPSEN